MRPMGQLTFIKYPKIPLLDNALRILNNKIYIFEKLDGGNCQFRKVDNRIRCGNRSNFIEGTYFDRGWFPAFRKWAMSNYSLCHIPENLIFFGEWLSVHEIQYSPGNMNRFYLIDIMDLDNKKFIDYRKAADIVREFNLENVNILNIIKESVAKKEDLESLTKKSDYYNGLREGLVIKDYERQLFAKMHNPFFQEILANRKLPPEERFVTERSVRKAISWLTEDKQQFSRADLIVYLRKNINEEFGILLDAKKIENIVKKVI